MAQHSYVTVDVFTDEPFGGNPLAVFPNAVGIPEHRMQQVAREFNLSETTFVLPASAAHNDFRVRIFTPTDEIPMAGHPTVGTAFVLHQEGHGKDGDLAFEEGVGDVPVTIEDAAGALEITMQQPRPIFGAEATDRAAIAELLSLASEDLDPEHPVQTVSCGLPMLLVPVRSRRALARIEPRLARWDATLSPLGSGAIYAFSLDASSGADVEARMFAPGLGVPEDPATGSAAGPLGCQLLRRGALSEGPELDLRISQGVDMRRPSRIRVRISAEPASGEIVRVRVGGSCVPVSRGEMEIPE